ncbi:MAG: DUF1028 domain-containing protein [Actinomycetia bacterium]|nr:DUF1028 domain-containing protein [Actinomycetes bacterium]MCP4085221.1 DUF1028 domain-containing protein [Actinomycetes bacterium]
MTYSVVARDPETGELGGAVQSHWFSVGTSVLWGEAGVGMVATQSMIERAYGPHGLSRMASGMAPADALAELTAADEGSAWRQVGLVDAKGRVATHTGSSCVEAAGHMAGDGWSIQANMMEHDTVWPAMASAFGQGGGLPLAERLLLTLDAGEAEGGDIRGRQSAALLVVAAQPSAWSWQDRLVDLRVDDHPDPLGELRRLLVLRRAYDEMSVADSAVEGGQVDDSVERHHRASQLVPDSAEIRFWEAIALVNAGRAVEAEPLLASIFGVDDRWRQFLARIATRGLVDADPATLDHLGSL